MVFSENISSTITKRKIEELNLIEDFLFTEASIDEKTAPILMRLIIERSTGLKVGKIHIEPQKTVNGVDTDCHGIRMDVTIREIQISAGENECKDGEETMRLFDVEPNNVPDTNLPKRSRYYQALTDVKLLETGVDYDKLPDMITIWILPYDPFGMDCMLYSVKNVVEEYSQLEYNDGIRKIFLYTGGNKGGSPALKHLLTYLQESVAKNAVDEELQLLHNKIEHLKNRKEIGVKYMQMHEVIKYKVRDEVEAIKPLLKEALREEVVAEVRQEVAAEVRQEVAAEVRQEVAAEVVKLKQRMADLTKFLLNEGRYEDLHRMAEDQDFCDKLLQTYQTKP